MTPKRAWQQRKRSCAEAHLDDRPAGGRGNSWYAVAYGHNGPRVYDNLQVAQQEVAGLSGGFYRGHATLQEAQDWLANEVELRRKNLASFSPSSSRSSPPRVSDSDADVEMSAVMPGAMPASPAPAPAPDANAIAAATSLVKAAAARAIAAATRDTYAFGYEPPGEGATSSQLEAFYFPALPGQQKRPASAVKAESGGGAVKAEAEVKSEPRAAASSAAVSPAATIERPLPPPSPAARAPPSPAGASTPTRPKPEAETVRQIDIAASEPEIVLSAQQEAIRKLVVEGCENICITGGGGTGKSVLMKRIIADCKALYGQEAVAVCATTGIAALHIGGYTLHSWAGIGLGNELPGMLAHKVSASRRSRDVWNKCKVLLIDEISMLDSFLFDKLDYVGRRVRGRSNQPFGGLQLVLVGDFFQLPPVVKPLPEPSAHLQDRKSVMVRTYNAMRNSYKSAYCFDARNWAEAVPQTVTLSQVFRQSDNRLVEMLEEVRRGRVSEDTSSFFSSLERPLAEDEFEPTQLFPTRNEVDICNQAHLKALKSPQHWFRAVDTAHELNLVDTKDLLDKKTIAQSDLKLKVGAQVMLIMNMTHKAGAPPLVNGSRGIVIGFARTNGVAAYVNSAGEASVTAAAMESEELGTSPIRLEIANATREGLGKPGSNTFIPTVSGNPNPIVRFANGREVLIPPFKFTYENPATATAVASRTQLPLILSWGISIHKAQGMTLDRMIVNLGRTFENGQAYVALSRIRAVEGLQVLQFAPHKIMADPRVIEWERTTTREVRTTAAAPPQVASASGSSAPPAPVHTAAGSSRTAIPPASAMPSAPTAAGPPRVPAPTSPTTDPSSSASTQRIYPQLPTPLGVPWWDRNETQDVDDEDAKLVDSALPLSSATATSASTTTPPRTPRAAATLATNPGRAAVAVPSAPSERLTTTPQKPITQFAFLPSPTSRAPRS